MGGGVGKELPSWRLVVISFVWLLRRTRNQRLSGVCHEADAESWRELNLCHETDTLFNTKPPVLARLIPRFMQPAA